MFFTYNERLYDEMQLEDCPTTEVTQDASFFIDCVMSAQPCSTPVGNGEAIKDIIMENDFEPTRNLRILLRTFLSGPFLNCYDGNRFSIDTFRKAHPASDLEDFMREFSKANSSSISMDADKAKTIINVLEDGEALDHLGLQDEDQYRIEALYDVVEKFCSEEEAREAAMAYRKKKLGLK